MVQDPGTGIQVSSFPLDHLVLLHSPLPAHIFPPSTSVSALSHSDPTSEGIHAARQTSPRPPLRSRSRPGPSCPRSHSFPRLANTSPMGNLHQRLFRSWSVHWATWSLYSSSPVFSFVPALALPHSSSKTLNLSRFTPTPGSSTDQRSSSTSLPSLLRHLDQTRLALPRCLSFRRQVLR